MALTEVVVTSTEEAPDGTPFTGGGTVTFTCTAELLDAATGKTYARLPVIGRYNAAGVLIGPDGATGVKLVANDDASVQPKSTTYRVAKNLNGTPQSPSFSITVPSAAPLVGGIPTVDLAALTWGR